MIYINNCCIDFKFLVVIVCVIYSSTIMFHNLGLGFKISLLFVEIYVLRVEL